MDPGRVGERRPHRRQSFRASRQIVPRLVTPRDG